MEIAIIIIVLLVGYIIFNAVKNNKQNSKPTTQPIDEITQDIEIVNIEILPYRKKLLLTKNEWSFYKSLKPIADELGYSVLAKIRVADLVEVTTKDRSEWQRYFNKINKKHIDFVLAKPENLQVILLIELDDNSHNEAQKQRDEFVDLLYKQTEYNFLHVRGTGELKEKIINAIK